MALKYDRYSGGILVVDGTQLRYYNNNKTVNKKKFYKTI